MADKLLSELNKGEWSGSTAYTVGAIVSHNGSSYICIANSTNQEPPNASYWAILAEKGHSFETKTIAPTGSGYAADYYTDGTADDIEIQEAIDAAHAIGGGDVLIKNLGNIYSISNSIQAKSNVNIIVEEGTTIKLANATNLDMLVVNGVTNITINGLVLDGNKTNQTIAKSGINILGNSTKIRLKNLYVKSTTADGIKAFQASDFRIQDCTAYQCGKTGLVGQGNGGFNISTCYDFVLQNCKADACDYEGLNVFTCYDFSMLNCSGINSVTEHGTHPNRCYNFSIIGGRYSNNTIDGIKAIDCYKYKIIGVEALENGNIGINASCDTLTSHEITIVGNVSNSNVRGIYCSNGGSGTEFNVTISGNMVVGNSSWGIGLSNAHDCAISGNVSKNNLYGIILSGAASINNTISGNRCYDDQVSPTQVYGFVDSDFSTVTGNDFTGNSNSNSVLTPGVNSNYSSNKGYHKWIDGRQKTNDTEGGDLDVQAEGATQLATDKDGGDLNLKTGQSTGRGATAVRLWTYKPTASTSTADNSIVNVLTVNQSSSGSIFIAPANGSAGAVGNFTSYRAKGAGSGVNLNGGDLALEGGRATGSGSSNIDFRTATPNTGVAGALSSILINAVGSGYTAGDVLAIIGGGGSLGTATVNTVAGIGVISGVAINALGSGYVVGDVLIIAGGNGNATITVATVSAAGGIQSYTLSGGTGYSTATGVSLTGGSGTGATLDISSIYATGAITGITLTDIGSGYSSTTGAATTGGTGTGATLDLTPIKNSINTPSTKAFLTGDGKLGIGTITPTALFDINSDVLRLRTAKTPASAAATGNRGDICTDDSYIYVCTATNTWKRAAIATW
jgi:parallel beta-helix repeat protein